MVSYAVLQGILFIFIFLLSSYTTLSIFTNTPPNQINNTEILVDQILQDYYNSCRTSCPLIPSLRIYSIKNIAEEADGLTGPYWYFLEKLSGRKLVTLVNYGNNLEPIIEDPDQHYLICPILERNKNFVKGLCIEEYIKIHDNLASRLYTIMTLPTEELNNLYVVYKWSNNN
jgi:hypothetical protein